MFSAPSPLLHCRERPCPDCVGELDCYDMFDPDGSFFNYNAETARCEQPAFDISSSASAVGASPELTATDGRGSTMDAVASRASSEAMVEMFA